MYMVQLLFNIGLLLVVHGFECDEHAKICETSLDVHLRLPMMATQGPVYPHNGKLYMYNVTKPSNAMPINKDEIITADGKEDSSRMVVTANGTLPGPSIIVYEGQTVVVHVKNNLQSQATTIHWHGLDMKDNPWMDGAPYITQCPIAPGQKFTYKFTAKPVGTFWYHSHMGHQRLNGLFGAFIVRQKSARNVPRMTEHILQVFEWNHDHGSDADEAYESMEGVFINRRKLSKSVQLDHIHYTTYYTHAGLFNGRGRFWNTSTTHNGAPLETFNVEASEKYLFRVICTGALYPWRISVDNHNITLVASDAFELEPEVVESFVISPGERYSFTLETNQPVGNYWIRGETLERTRTRKAEAILRYKGASETDPTTSKSVCTSEDKCTIVNCPFPFYPENENVNCIRMTSLRTKLNVPTPHAVPGKFQEYFLNFAFPSDDPMVDEGPAAINGRAFTLPPVSALTQAQEITNQCSDQDCGEGKLCQCFNSLTINKDDLIQMTFLNTGNFRQDDHPVHMHGHAFMVIKVGYGEYNMTTGAFIRDNQDIDCRGNMCNDATWRNSSWLNGNVPDITGRGAVIKDTVYVPSGGYVTVRFPATMPGIWFLHCHIDLHANDGMAMVLNESFAEIPKPPAGFPECRNFEVPIN